MEDKKKSLNFMSAKLSKLALQQKLLMNLVKEVKLLKDAITDRNKKIAKLQKRIDDLEKYTIRDDLVITGLEIKNRTYARVTANVNTTEDSSQELKTLEQQVVTFAKQRHSRST